MATLLFGAAATASSPATAGLIGTAGKFALSQTLLTGGTFGSAFGALSMGQAAAQQAKNQQDILEYNAQLKERESARGMSVSPRGE